MLLSNRVQNITSSIAQYQEQIEELQGKIAALQRHQQECEGVNASCENALEQLRVALNLVRAICPEEEHTLRNAVETLFNPAVLEGRTEVENVKDVEVEAVNLDVEAGTKVEDANVEDVVNVEAVNVEDTNVEDVEDVNVEERDSRRFLLSLTKAKLLDIAKTKGIKISSSKTKEEIVNLLLKEIQASGI